MATFWGGELQDLSPGWASSSFLRLLSQQALQYGAGRAAIGEMTFLIAEETSRRSPIWLPPLSTKISSLFTIIKVRRATRVIQGWLCHSQGW